jgi:hypothetical protein
MGEYVAKIIECSRYEYTPGRYRYVATTEQSTGQRIRGILLNGSKKRYAYIKLFTWSGQGATPATFLGMSNDDRRGKRNGAACTQVLPVTGREPGEVPPEVP